MFWWKTWGSSSCPELTTVAMRVLARALNLLCLQCSASVVVIRACAYGNRLVKELAKKLVTERVYFNGRANHDDQALKLDWESPSLFYATLCLDW